ncbi:MAG: chitobiase/beta-hexosaminidase C-terminal domain-containing protein [Lachnospiraceae bacterium]|nr:chitobiase/beta-hexosaminidase C-terminal domain-containing protein [Lachnospiraceae bacterium]
MKCPNCGEEIGEGLLYCEKCGEDIHIVPDFEPELEQNIAKNLENIVQEVGGAAEGKTMPKPETTALSAGGKLHTSKMRLLLVWVMLIAFTGLLFYGGIRIYQYYSPEYQTQKARQLVAAGQYDKAILFIERAMELDPLNVDLKLDMAQVYFFKNDKDSYAYWLQSIVQDPGADREQLESAYGKLIAIYRAREDYQAINDMLLACPDETIRMAYQSYLAESPQFSVTTGEYDEVKALKLTVTGGGKIYYSMDGQEPGEDQILYTAPILLENGDYEVKAVYINENGVRSAVVTHSYHIAVAELEAPELSVDSGTYERPVSIRVVNDTQNIYYTMDGTHPTMESLQYIEPIPMPIGESNFCFARLEIGRSSAVVDRKFELDLKTDFTPNQAVDAVREAVLATGKIVDNEGHFDDTAAHYEYQYLYVITLEEDNVAYIVSEVYVDAAGNPGRTGNYYAVNVYTGTLYGVHMEDGKFQLNGEQP